MQQPPNSTGADLLDDGPAAENLLHTRPVLWAVTLFGPILLTLGAIGFAWISRGGVFAQRLTVAGVITFFGAGKFIILGGQDPSSEEAVRTFTRGELALLVIWLEVFTACVVVYHLGAIFALPKVGPRLAALADNGRFIMKSQPWMRKATLIGLIVVIATPMAGSGGVGGAIFGRLLGLSRPMVLVGIFIGSVIGCAVMYFGADVIRRHVGRDNPWMMVLGIGTFIGVILLLNARYNRLKKADAGASAAKT